MSSKSFNIKDILLNISNIILEGTFSVYESELVESSSISADFVFNNPYLYIQNYYMYKIDIKFKRYNKDCLLYIKDF